MIHYGGRSMKVFIGRDPGAKGSMAVMTQSPVFVYSWDIKLVPWEDDLMSYIAALKAAKSDPNCVLSCALEHVGAMPGQGVTSMFNFGANFGRIIGVLTTLCVPFELVRPQRWQKEFGISGDKAEHVAACKRLFPNVSLLRTVRSRKDDDGHADALLLAEWSRRHHG